MAISLYTEFEVRTDGHEYNGAGFAPISGAVKTRTDNYTYGPSYAVYSGSNLTLDSSDATLAMPDGYTPKPEDIGHLIRISNNPSGWSVNGGGYYQIVGIQSGKWQLDRAPGSAGSSGGAWRLGGATNYFAIPGGCAYQLAPTPSGSNELTPVIWVRSGTYTQSNTNQNAQGGYLYASLPVYNFHLIGYSASRGDGGYATINTSSAGTGPVYGAVSVQNIRFYSTSGTTGFGVANTRSVHRCCFENFSSASNPSMGVSNAYTVTFCEAVNCYYGFRACQSLLHCVAHTCNIGFVFDSDESNRRSMSECIAHRCTTGFGHPAANATVYSLYRCHAIHCTTGFDLPPYPASVVTGGLHHWANCSASNCTTAISMDQQAQRTICAPFYHHNCGTLKSGETSTNKFLSEQFVALPTNPFPGAGSSTPYSSSNYAPKFIGNLANYNAIINKSWPFGLFFFDATVFSEPLNMRGGFPG